jgi:hypothetical protein
MEIRTGCFEGKLNCLAIFFFFFHQVSDNSYSLSVAVLYIHLIFEWPFQERSLLLKAGVIEGEMMQHDVKQEFIVP